MSKKPIAVLMLLSAICIIGCGIKTKFSESDLKWMNVYNEGDTLIFQSDKGQYDTSVIVKKQIFYPEYNPVEVHDQYLPEWGVVWYKNKNLVYHPEGTRLLSITKKEPAKKTSLVIKYLYSSAVILNMANGELDKIKQGKVYEFDTYHPKAESSQPKKIFWHEDYGIIKYITHDNVVWQRINLK